MSISPATLPRSIAQWAVTIVFGLLSAAFLFRALQFGYKWLSGAVEPETNFKAMTIWALIYVVVCAGIAAVAYLMPREAEEAERPEDNQQAERGT
jgi:TRAP-type C4-dicarboxylate transport system permease small subunit